MNRDAAEGNSILGPTVRLESMARGLSGTREQHAPAVILILALTALLLMLACVNLGGLLLTRLSARSTELGVRLALGGSRGRIAQQMLVESLCLSLAGAALAIPVADLFLWPIPSFLDPGFAGWELSFAPDVGVLAGTAATGVGVGLALTILPVWFALRRQSSVRFTWDRTMTGATSRWTRGLLVAQVALSVVIVIGAGLLTRSLYLIKHNDPGVHTANKLSVDLMALPGGARGLNAEVHYPALIDKLIAIPGVRAVGFALVFPRRLSDVSSDIGFAGEEFTGVRSSLDSVSANFFDLMGIPVLAGRSFTPADTARTGRVVIVSESLARALAPQGNVVGRRLRFQTQRAMQDLEVVGIVG
ncbi:MAG: ABC transporter permease, partial [Acidobacteriota bacterium]|nr:ABC transporter permease [Acidobacteriota bacterium]